MGQDQAPAAPPADTDRSACPLCGLANQCAMEAAAGSPASASCWCAGAEISAAALASLPAEALGRACLCPRCASLPAHPQ